MEIALIGCGTVGKGFIELINEKKDFLGKYYNFEPRLIAISDPKYGSVYDEDGLDIQKVLTLLEQQNSIKDYPGGVKGWNSEKTITDTKTDTIVEVTPTNLDTGEPGLSFIRKALASGKNVTTTNKGPIALAYAELKELSVRNNCMLKFEGTVLAGTPALNLTLGPLAGIEIKEVKGIMNGTTNYILTRMESGLSYKKALEEAQNKGYAEAKPDADVKGWDAVAKIIIIANVLMNGNISVSDVDRKGIDEITLDDVENALKEDKHWKLIARAWKENGSIRTSVKPVKLDKEDPLARIEGATNAITFDTDILRAVTIIGPGAGKRETGFALLSDIIEINKIKED